jgi:hypothetical protein
MHPTNPQSAIRNPQSVPPSYWLACGLRQEHLHATLDDTHPHAAVLENFLTPQGATFLLLTGPNGTGKSHIGAALLKHHGSGVFATMPELLQLQRNLPFDDSGDRPTRARFNHTLKTCRILIIDELGRSSGGVDENQLLDDVLCFRHDRRLPTVLISNLDTAALALHLGACIADRIIESNTHLALNGLSRRTPGRPRGDVQTITMFTGILPRPPEPQNPEGWPTWLDTHYPAQKTTSPMHKFAPDWMRAEFAAARRR